MSREIETKTERLVDALRREKLGGVLINAQHNFAWMTGGAANGVDLSRENGVANIFVRNDGKRFLLANNIEMPRLLGEEVSGDDFEPLEYSWQLEKSTNAAKDIAATLSDGEIVGDAAVSGVGSFESAIAGCRHSLVEEEIERLRELGRDAGIAMRNVFDLISPGDTEIEIAARLRSQLAGSDIQSVVTLVASDERIARFRHPVPTSNTLKETVLLVTCAKRNGLIASVSRIATFGKLSAELIEKTEATAFVNASLIAATRAGVSGSELYAVAADAYAVRGFGDEIDKHHQGGAAGYKTREWVAHPLSKDVVVDHQAFAWNPSITGTKVEDTVLISCDKTEVLTTSPDFPVTVNTIDGREYGSTGILSKH